MGNDSTPSDNAEIPTKIAQQHGGTGADNVKELPEGFSLQKAAELIEDGEYAVCLSLLDKQTEPKTGSRLSALRLICQICLKAHDGQWWQVTLSHLSLPEPLLLQSAFSRQKLYPESHREPLGRQCELLWTSSHLIPFVQPMVLQSESFL